MARNLDVIGISKNVANVVRGLKVRKREVQDEA